MDGLAWHRRGGSSQRRDSPARHGRGLVPGSEATQTSGWSRRCHRETGRRRGHAAQMGTRWLAASHPARSTGDGVPLPPSARWRGWGGPKHPHVGVCGALDTPSPLFWSLVCAQHIWGGAEVPPRTHIRGCPSLVRALAAGQCLSLAHSGGTVEVAPLAHAYQGVHRGAGSLSPPPAAVPAVPSPAHPHPHESSRPRPADTNGKSPPVTASWQPLPKVSKGFRVPQPARPPTPPGQCGGSGSRRTPPAFIPTTLPSASVHACPAPSSSSPCTGHPLPSSGSHQQQGDLGSHLRHPPALGTHCLAQRGGHRPLLWLSPQVSPCPPAASCAVLVIRRQSRWCLGFILGNRSSLAAWPPAPFMGLPVTGAAAFWGSSSPARS